jgi:hypothetical protein
MNDPAPETRSIEAKLDEADRAAESSPVRSQAEDVFRRIRERILSPSDPAKKI